MDFNVDKLISSRAIETVRRLGLHKVAGALEGVDEMTLKTAVAIIGRKAFMRRKEAGQIFAGIASLAELTGEKNASWVPLLQRAIGPAILGAGIGVLPDLVADGPLDKDKALQHALMGGAVGGIAGMGNAVYKNVGSDPALQNLLGGVR